MNNNRFACSPVIDIDLDPWSQVLLPATMGEHGAALAAMDLLEAHTPPDGRPELYAVSARALLAMDHGTVAEAVLDGALALGGIHAAALASVIRPDGERWCKARLALGGPGDRADAWCDLAWLHARRGEMSDATAALEGARHELPRHAEAGRWVRFMERAGGDATAVLRRAATVATPDGQDAGARDAFELVPRAELGMLSAERLLRRLGTGSWPARPGRPSALACLREMGVVTAMLATPADYSSVAPHHPLVMLEWEVDHILSLAAEGARTDDACGRLWAGARALDREATWDAANFLVPHGICHDEARPVALEAVAVLCDRDPDQSLWRAYQAHLWATDNDPRGLVAARLVLERGADSDVAFWLALDALHVGGASLEARRRARLHLGDSQWGAPAAQALEDWRLGRRVSPSSGPRQRPRFPAGQAH
jgi:hypothetical protein